MLELESTLGYRYRFLYLPLKKRSSHKIHKLTLVKFVRASGQLQCGDAGMAYNLHSLRKMKAYVDTYYGQWYCVALQTNNIYFYFNSMSNLDKNGQTNEMTTNRTLINGTPYEVQSCLSQKEKWHRSQTKNRRVAKYTLVLQNRYRLHTKGICK